MTRILIVDDHTIFRQALEAILIDSMPEGTIACDCVGSAEAARLKLENIKYHAVILDISMPQEDGMVFLPELVGNHPDTPVLMLSMFQESQYALQAFRLGARGYLSKQEAVDELLSALHCLWEGGRYLSKSFSASLLTHALEIEQKMNEPLDLLSKREREVLQLLKTGDSLTRIAARLGLSIKTVSTYKSRLSAKLGFKSNADIIHYDLLLKSC